MAGRYRSLYRTAVADSFVNDSAMGFNTRNRSD
jgi:hypothetical protein